MSGCQPAILAPVPRAARFLSFARRPGTDAAAALRRLADRADAHVIVGLGLSLAQHLGADVPGLRALAPRVAHGVDVPSTPAALWLRVSGDDLGEALHRARPLVAALADAFEVDTVVDAFRHRDSRDLSGYEDGTENPEGEDAVAAVTVTGERPGIAGGAFVAVQQWRHDLDALDRMDALGRDHVIGRRLEDNEELADAPPAAHVKRTAQEDFEPEAFVVRRSMPWADGARHGLVFVSFGDTLDKFDAQLDRMCGLDDGVVDNLFRITRPLTSAAFFCPPVDDAGRLDLSAVLR